MNFFCFASSLLFRQIDNTNTNGENKCSGNNQRKAMISCVIAAQTLDNLHAEACDNQRLTNTSKDSWQN